MSNANGHQLPPGWVRARLSEIAQINPPLDRCILNDSVAVDFVPMRAVEPEGGGLLRPEVSNYGAVKKGFTAFLSGDVIMAKITPCMENGKTCVVPDLPGAACFGSTEFHVIRAEREIEARWIANFLLQHSTRHLAQRQMTGGVGQMRVPAAFIESISVPVPPAAEQHRILENTDELLSDLDAGVAGLARVKAKLKQYRAAVLKAAAEGTLTAEWRAQHPATEPAFALLTRILAERRRRWEEAQLRKFEDAGKTPPKSWKAKYKEPLAPITEGLPPIPDNWCWASPEQLASPGDYSLAIGPFGSNLKVTDYTTEGVPLIFVRNIRSGIFDDRKTHFVSKKKADELRAHRVIPGDLLITKMGDPPGDARIYPSSLPSAILTADCIKITLSSQLPEHGFFSFVINSNLAKSQIAQITKGVAQLKVSLGRFASIALPLPCLEEHSIITEAVEDQLSVVDRLEADLESKLKSAQALRQSILRHAFTGQLVPQDPNDELAAELLKRIAAQREELAGQVQAARKTRPKRVTKKRAVKQTRKKVSHD